MKKLFSVLLASVLTAGSLAQYGPDDRDLAATTFTREFDELITLSYLGSEDTAKVNAALLSLSHAADTTIIAHITAVPFDQHAVYIAFALGQIGPSATSAEYLWYYIENRDPLEPYYPALVEALGKCGDAEDYEKLFTLASKDDFQTPGIALAMFYFNSRGLAGERVTDVFIAGLLSGNARHRLYSAFGLYRAGGDSSATELLLDNINREAVSEDDISVLIYSLASLRAVEHFPGNAELLERLVTHSDYRVRIEAARACVNYPFATRDELELYLSLLEDSNPNVSRQAAVQCAQLELSDELKPVFNERARALLDENLPVFTFGEFVLALAAQKPETAAELYTSFSNELLPPHRFRLLAAHPEAFDLPAALILQDYEQLALRDRIDAVSAALGLDTELWPDGLYEETVLAMAASDDGAIAAVTFFSADSAILHDNRDKLSGLILSQTESNLNNPSYLEAFMAFRGFIAAYDSTRLETLDALFAASEQYSVRKLADETMKKELGNFDELWKNAFTYSRAKFTTTKGEFTIRLLPQYAPVTVGNFCHLVEQGILENNIIHRVVPGFVIQGGDPTETGWGGPGYEIISEFSPLQFTAGRGGIASVGKDTEGCQWFFMQGNFPHLNGRYTVWSEVIEGMETVAMTGQLDKVLTIELIK